MDPIANLNEQRELAKCILTRLDTADREGRSFTPVENADAKDDAERLAELIIALDEWNKSGGYDPYRKFLDEIRKGYADHDLTLDEFPNKGYAGTD